VRGWPEQGRCIFCAARCVRILTVTVHGGLLRKQRERSAANDKVRKLEEENLRLKRMLEQQGGKNAGGAQESGKKRKATSEEPEQHSKQAKGDQQPGKKSKKDPGGKSKGKLDQDESNFMKMIRDQGLDTPSTTKGVGSNKSTTQAALEQDLREIEELKAKLGGNWRGELAEDGWLDLFDSLDSKLHSCPTPNLTNPPSTHSCSSPLPVWQ